MTTDEVYKSLEALLDDAIDNGLLLEVVWTMAHDLVVSSRIGDFVDISPSIQHARREWDL